MFEENNRVPAGAKDKHEIVKKMQAAGQFKLNAGGQARYPSQTIPVTLIFALSVILAFLLTGNNSNPLSGMHLTGLPSVDNFITGTDIQAFTSDPDQNKVFTIMGRGAAFFILGGFIPLLTFLIEKVLLDRKVMPLIICWGVIVALIVFYIFIPLNTILPFFKGILPFVKSL